MKKYASAIGKAVLYTLAFPLLQGITSFVCIIGAMFSYAAQYPALTHSNTSQALLMYLSKISGNSELMIGILLLSNLMALLITWLFFRLRKKKLLHEIPMRKTSLKNLLASALIGISVPFSIGILLNFIPFSEEMAAAYEENSQFLDTEMGIIPILSVAIVSPIAEEVFFRGLVHTRLRRALSPVCASLLSAALFALGHPGMIWFVSTFAAGLLMAWVFETTHSLYAPILVHIGNNTVTQLTGENVEVPVWWILIACVVLTASVIFLATNPDNRKQTNFETASL